MQSIEPRNEQLMLRQFWKKHPTYNLNAMMRRRYEELMDAKAFFALHTHRRVTASVIEQALVGPVSLADYCYLASTHLPYPRS